MCAKMNIFFCNMVKKILSLKNEKSRISLFKERRGEKAKKMFDIECVVEVCLTNLTSAPMDIKMRSLQ